MKMKRVSTTIVILLSVYSFAFSQQKVAKEFYSTGDIYLGMPYSELRNYATISDPEKPVQWVTLNSGFNNPFLELKVSEIQVLLDHGKVKKIFMKLPIEVDHTELHSVLSNKFGKDYKTEGNGDLYRSLWTNNEYAVDLNGGLRLSQYYLYLMYTEDIK